MIVSESNYLAHHGVLGMKWGVRRTPEQLGHRVKNRLENNRRVERLTEKNKKKGMRSEVAKTKAQKRVKTEAAVIGAAALGVAARKAHLHVSRNYIDRTLKAGTKFRTLTTDPERDMARVYATYKKRDVSKYKGLFSMHLRRQSNQVYSVTRSATKNVKLASKKNASKAFLDLYKTDPAFKNKFDFLLEYHASMNWMLTPQEQQLISKIAKSGINDKTLMKEGYEFFNVQLVNPKLKSYKLDTMFYDKLKKMGYSAIEDINDIKYSGYKAKSPIIVFDMESVVKESVSKLDSTTIIDSFKLETFRMRGEPYVKGIAAVASASTSVQMVRKPKEGDK